ncbi:MAG: hypothetical protein RR123_04160, partial [Clostridia bacterium]
MLTLVCGGALCCCSSYIGFAINWHYKKRNIFFSEMLNFIDFVTDNISFLKSPLQNIITTFIQNKKNDFAKLLWEYLNILQSGQNVNLQNLSNLLNLNLLKNDEKELVINFFNSLGKLDSETQLFNLKNYKTQIKKFGEQAEKKLKVTG